MAVYVLTMSRMVRVILIALAPLRHAKRLRSGDATDACLSNPKRIRMKLRVNWGRTSAHHPKRVSADSAGETTGLVSYVDEALDQCVICRVRDEAPHIPIAGTSAVLAFNRKMQVDFVLPNAAIALHAMDFYPNYSPIIPTRSKNPQKYGVSLAARGLLFSAGRSVFR